MSRRHADRLLAWALGGAAGLSGAIVLLIAAFLVLEAWPALRDIGPVRLLSDGSWHPAADAVAGTYDLGPMLAGTLLAALGAMLLAAPLGVLSAVFTRFYAPPQLARAYRRIVEIMGGIPSVVYGFWGLVVLVPIIGSIRAPGASLLAGSLVLAIMILPTLALAAEAALENVPREVVHGAAALGMSRSGTAWRVALPAARSGLVTGAILQTGRALGETMAILMVAGNVVQVPGSVFDPVRTLTANIALEMAYAMGDHRSALFVSGLLLMAVVTALVIVAERLDRGLAHG